MELPPILFRFFFLIRSACYFELPVNGTPSLFDTALVFPVDTWLMYLVALLLLDEACIGNELPIICIILFVF